MSNWDWGPQMRFVYRLVKLPDGRYFIGEEFSDSWYIMKPTWGLIKLAQCESLDDIVELTEDDVLEWELDDETE